MFLNGEKRICVENLGTQMRRSQVKGEEQQSKIGCAFHEGGGHQYQALLRSSQMKTSSKRKS